MNICRTAVEYVIISPNVGLIREFQILFDSAELAKNSTPQGTFHDLSLDDAYDIFHVVVNHTVEYVNHAIF